jgi:hypothetical protein
VRRAQVICRGSPRGRGAREELRGQRMSLGKISVALAARGYVTAGDKPYVATAVQAMLGGPIPKGTSPREFWGSTVAADTMSMRGAGAGAGPSRNPAPIRALSYHPSSNHLVLIFKRGLRDPVLAPQPWRGSYFGHSRGRLQYGAAQRRARLGSRAPVRGPHSSKRASFVRFTSWCAGWNAEPQKKGAGRRLSGRTVRARWKSLGQRPSSGCVRAVFEALAAKASSDSAACLHTRANSINLSRRSSVSAWPACFVHSRA